MLLRYRGGDVSRSAARNLRASIKTASNRWRTIELSTGSFFRPLIDSIAGDQRIASAGKSWLYGPYR